MAFVEEPIRSRAIPPDAEPAAPSDCLERAPHSVEEDEAGHARFDALDVAARHRSALGERGLRQPRSFSKQREEAPGALVLDDGGHPSMIGGRAWPRVI